MLLSLGFSCLDFRWPDKHVCRQSVQAAPAESFYSHPHMGPYQFFDCAHGKHESRGGASLFNKARTAPHLWP